MNDYIITYICPLVFETYSTHVQSSSNPSKSYWVHYNRDGGWYCECKGFHYRGHCQHVANVRGEKCLSFAESEKGIGPLMPGLCDCGNNRIAVEIEF